MNTLPPSITSGTFGEILVQLRFLQHSVQAAPPVKDTGNDLIAVRGECFRAVQVKTTCKLHLKFRMQDLPERYHILALVFFHDLTNNDRDNFSVPLDKSRIFLLDKAKVKKGYWNETELRPYEFGRDRINQLFAL